MTLALPPQLVPLVEQVRANPRLQAGLGLVLLLVAGWLVAALSLALIVEGCLRPPVRPTADDNSGTAPPWRWGR